MRFIKALFLLFITCNIFAQTQGNVPLHNLRHASGTNFVIKSGVGGKAEWAKDSIYFGKYWSVASAPLGAKKGDFWRSTANQNTYFWDGIDWRLIAKTDSDTSEINELIESVVYSNGFLSIQDKGAVYNIDLRDTLFGTIDTTGLVNLIKAVAPIRKDTLFGTVDTTGLRNFVRNQASAVDKFTTFQNIGGNSAVITFSDGKRILGSPFIQDGIQIVYDVDEAGYVFKYYERDGIIGNETGRLWLSNDSIYYKKAPDSLTIGFKLLPWLQDSLNARSRIGHGHVINDIAFLQDNLNLKSNVNHTHVIGNVTGLQDSLNARANETTATIQAKRPLKTIESQSLEGSGNIDLVKADVGLSNVDNTSDLNKPISTSTQTALNSKIGGSGTNNYLTKFNGTNAINNSLLYQDANNIYMQGASSFTTFKGDGGFDIGTNILADTVSLSFTKGFNNGSLFNRVLNRINSSTTTGVDGGTFEFQVLPISASSLTLVTPLRLNSNGAQFPLGLYTQNSGSGGSGVVPNYTSNGYSFIELPTMSTNFAGGSAFIKFPNINHSSNNSRSWIGAEYNGNYSSRLNFYAARVGDVAHGEANSRLFMVGNDTGTKGHTNLIGSADVGNTAGANILETFKVFGDMAVTTDMSVMGNVGIGTTTPNKTLEVNSPTGNNLRLTYNLNNFVDFKTLSSGNLNIEPSGDVINLHSQFSPSNSIVNLLSSGESRQNMHSGGVLTSPFTYYVNGGAYGSNYAEMGLNLGTTEFQQTHIHFDTRPFVAPFRFFVSAAGGGAIDAMDIFQDGSVQLGSSNTKYESTRFAAKGLGSTSSTFAAKFFNSSNTELFSIRDDGNVGIGTSTPTEKLHVSGNIRATSIPSYATTAAAAADAALLQGSFFKVTNGNGTSQLHIKD